MIKEIGIQNFKSVKALTLSLGRVNVLIGSNGSGKSNILEAIAFAGAATADKLDNEFLSSRGIRPSDPQLMKNAFQKIDSALPIKLSAITENQSFFFTIEEDKTSPISKWIFKEKKDFDNIIIGIFNTLFEERSEQIELSSNLLEDKKDKINTLINSLRNFNLKTAIDDPTYREEMINYMTEQVLLLQQRLLSKEIENFIIYSPEISSLRKFEEESQIKPIGIKGEGLFSVLQIFNERYGKETIEELKEYLHVIEWFDDFEATYEKFLGRSVLVVKDRYIPDISLNQTNVNEGFLFLLFYISLLISNETPSFFAIDNIEASFHPKLCEDLVKNMVKLAKKHNKQIILTTHNPFVLDGLDLNDIEQCLYVVRRNGDGETIADKITQQPKNVKSPEAWLRGYIGGNPETIE